MTTHESRRSSRWDHIEIDEGIKKLLLAGVRKAGSQHELAKIMGYSTPTNIITQFRAAPTYKKYILRSRLEKLEKFLHSR